MKFVIVANRRYYYGMKQELEKRLIGCEFTLFTQPADLSVQMLHEIKPRYIFFPHWSHIIPEEIYKTFECVVFHMTDLPFGRGGSPMQNLISRGIYNTQISALRCEKGLDAGPIYLKRSLCLHGGAEEIYLRAKDIMLDMIETIISSNSIPSTQTGVPVVFRRRTPAESNIEGIDSLVKLFDHIRMLDAEGYPQAYLEVGNFRFEFRRAALYDKRIMCDVMIQENEHD